MKPEIFMFVACLCLTPVTSGESERRLTQTILLPKLNVNVVVNCHSLQQETGSSFRHWVLTNLVVIGGNSSGGNSPRNINVSPNNFSLGIWRIAGDQMGDYLCYAEDTSGRPLYSRTSIRLYAPPIWETYRMNFIMSLSASGIFFVIATIFCVVTSLRWRKTAPDPEGDLTLPVKSNGSRPEEPRGDFEFSVGPKVMTSGVMAPDEFTVSDVTRVKPGSPLVKVNLDAEVENDTAM